MYHAVQHAAHQLESCLNGLEERLRQYHAACHRLSLLPASAKRAAGVAYDIALNRAAVTPQELINGDIKVCATQQVVVLVAGVGLWLTATTETVLAEVDSNAFTAHCSNEP
jgi:kinetochore protein NDC80